MLAFDLQTGFRLVFLLILILLNVSLKSQDSVLSLNVADQSYELSQYVKVLNPGRAIENPSSLDSYLESDWITLSEINAESLGNESWCKLDIYNPLLREQSFFLNYNFYLDSIDVYRKLGSDYKLLRSNGINVPYSQRERPSFRSSFILKMEPNDTIKLYSRILQENPVSKNWIKYQSLDLAKFIQRSDLTETAVQYLILGILLVFVLLGLVLFYIFREKGFVFYSCLIFCEAINFYFTTENHFLLLGLTGSAEKYVNQWPFMAASFLFLYVFIANRLSLGIHRPVMNRFYKWLSIIFFILSILFIYLIPKPGVFPALFILALIILGLSLWAILDAKASRHPEANNLLFSMSILLFFGVLATILGFFQVGTDNSLTHALQFGSVAFAASLLYSLFQRVTGIRLDKLRLEIEKEKSDELLFNVLPKEIAQELKDNGTSEAKHIDQVSVLFTDFKGFTQLSEKISAAELLEELQYYFECFDHIMEEYGIEKIKTIGDSYMAAAGLSDGEKDSAVRITLAALRMIDIVSQRQQKMHDSGKESFSMRVGIHTGSVVAGVVGVKKFQYDIWGDTVNTASRMESHGEVGKLNISSATYERIKHGSSFSFEYRGKLETKGKGAMDMYFVRKA